MDERRLPDTPAPRLRFLGVTYHRLTPREALDALLARPADAPFATLVTPNAAHVARIAEGGAQAEPYVNAWLCLNDSRVVELLAKTRGLDLPSVPGSDLVANLLSDPRFDRAAPLLLVGGDAELFRALVAKVGLTAADHYEAPMGLLTNRDAFEATISAVETHPARFTLLAVGSPQQEKLAEELRRRGVARGVGLCIGASVEFLVGRRPRAPRWMSRAGLEWLFRLSTEPRRMWRRYVIESPRILLLYVRDLGRRGDAA
ncbi:WecB/TagA/CpsF family glycosyltransferase [Methylopila musalis]|uniref:WecB/TagA/CpsF family glycosyltransferase n=1 Tax=Methylopila musalis TaxID=1134781 RepID=A0ABW3ZB83_9HYPH